MKKLMVASLMLMAAGAWAGTYSQNFDGYADGTTVLGDGTQVLDNGSGVTEVYNYSGSTSWSALRLTQDNVKGQIGNFVIGDLDAGDVVTGFTATFDTLIKADSTPADGFSFNFGTLGSTPYGGEEGMYAGSGQMLSVCWDTYGPDIGIDIIVNGSTVSHSSVSPVVESSIDVAFRAVTIVWDESGLDVMYGGTSVFSDEVIGFSAGSGAEFAFAARTGDSFEDVFIDNLNITTVPEPASVLLLGSISASMLFIRRRFMS